MDVQAGPTMEELFNQYASASMVKEGNAFRVVPKGQYAILIKKADPRFTKDKGDGTEPRPYAHFTADILNSEGKRQAGLFFNASWVEGRRTDGKLDGMSKLWANIEKAYDMVGKSVGEVLGACTRYPVYAFIDLYFTDQADQRHYISSGNGVSPEDQEKDYYQQGYTPGNSVLNIYTKK